MVGKHRLVGAHFYACCDEPGFFLKAIILVVSVLYLGQHAGVNLTSGRILSIFVAIILCCSFDFDSEFFFLIIVKP